MCANKGTWVIFGIASDIGIYCDNVGGSLAFRGGSLETISLPVGAIMLSSMR